MAIEFAHDPVDRRKALTDIGDGVGHAHSVSIDENKDRTSLAGCQAIVERDIPPRGLKARASTE
jgi:hypothetical protein